MANTNLKTEDQEINSSLNANGLPSTASSNQSGSNDFVKKLFQMLQEDNYKDVVKWTTNGDSFVVLNTNEFTKEILPRHFKHSNFASFVRQLNKYDFHKVKISNEEKQTYQYGEDAWEFKHPDFRYNDREALENIKRKGPSSKKTNTNNNSNNISNNLSGGNNSSSSINNGHPNNNLPDNFAAQNQAQFQILRDEINLIKTENVSLHQEISVLNTKYKTLIENIVALKSFDERYYNSMGVLTRSLVQAGINLPHLDFPNPNLLSMQGPPPSNLQAPLPPPPSSQQAKPSRNHSHSNSLSHLSSHPLQSPGDIHRFDQPFSQQPLPGTISQPNPSNLHHAHHSHQSSHPTPPLNDTPKLMSPQQLINPIAQSPGIPNHTSQGIAASPQQAPTSDQPINPANQNPPPPSATTLPQVSITDLKNPKFHVLLVEDDNVCIQLCRKFLVKYGCQVTVVTDGLRAISTVENTKYDLVLMDIVMPNLDGASATSVIRSFDTRTPIIAMTGNIEDNDLVTYLQNGMSDILAKPFSKDDLYSILRKHLLTVSKEATSANSSPNVTSGQPNLINPGTAGSPPLSNPATGPAITSNSISRNSELDLSALQGPAQQTLILPHEDISNREISLAEPLMKKQRLN